MDALALLLHLANFVAPAVGLAALLAAALWLRAPRQRRDTLARSFSWLALGGALVLLAGLVVFGRDGKMATYAALVLVTGSIAWWRARG